MKSNEVPMKHDTRRPKPMPMTIPSAARLQGPHCQRIVGELNRVRSVERAVKNARGRGRIKMGRLQRIMFDKGALPRIQVVSQRPSRSDAGTKGSKANVAPAATTLIPSNLVDGFKR